jgi:hypothetical protein
MLVVDANGIGASVVDYLVTDLQDGYPPYAVVNDERYDAYKQPNSVAILYALKAQNRETKNSDMIAHFMSTFHKGDITLLKSHHEGLKELKTHLKIKSTNFDNDSELSMPYIMTDLLCAEIMNLKYKQSGHDVAEERVSTTIQRDKYSALKYGLWIVYQEELKNKVNYTTTDYSDYFKNQNNNQANKKTIFGSSFGNPFSNTNRNVFNR